MLGIELHELGSAPRRFGGTVRLFGDLEKMQGVASSHVVRLARCLEQLEGVLADRGEHAETNRPSGLLRPPEQAVVQQRGERRQHVKRFAACGLGRRKRPTPDEHRQPLEQAALRIAEKRVAPVECSPKRLLACREIDAAAREHGKRAIEPREQVLRGEQPDVRRRELERERESVEPDTDLGHDVGICAFDRERWVDAAHAIDEQLQGVASVRFHCGQREWWNVVFALSNDAKGRPARHEHSEPRRMLQEGGYERRCRQQPLEVVEHEQRVAVGEVGRDCGRQVAALLREPEGRCDRRTDQPGVLERGKVDEERSSGQLRGELACDLDRESRLSDASRPRERHQAAVRFAERSTHGGNLESPPDQPGQRPRELRRGWRSLDPQRRIVAEDRALELAKPQARFDSELVRECPPGALKRLECFGLAVAAVEGEHQVRVEAFPERVRLHECSELGDNRLVPPERKLGVKLELDRFDSKLGDAVAFRVVECVDVESRERFTVP